MSPPSQKLAGVRMLEQAAFALGSIHLQLLGVMQGHQPCAAPPGEVAGAHGAQFESVTSLSAGTTFCTQTSFAVQVEQSVAAAVD